VQRLRKDARRDEVLLDVVEPAAVDLPGLAADPGFPLAFVLRWPKVVVERDEVERRSDPDDAGNDVQPARQQVEPVSDVRIDGQCPSR
jgi:hypothetical protein